MEIIIDWDPYYDQDSGSSFYFDTWDEMFEFIKMCSKSSYHSYYIKDFKEKEEKGKIDA